MSSTNRVPYYASCSDARNGKISYFIAPMRYDYKLKSEGRSGDCIRTVITYKRYDNQQWSDSYTKYDYDPQDTPDEEHRPDFPVRHNYFYESPITEERYRLKIYEDGYLEAFTDDTPRKIVTTLYLRYPTKYQAERELNEYLESRGALKAPPAPAIDIWQWAIDINEGRKTWEQAFNAIPEDRHEELALLYKSEYLTSELAQQSETLGDVIRQLKTQHQIETGLANLNLELQEEERQWTIDAGAQIEKMGMSIENLDSISPEAMTTIVQQAVDKLDFDEDIAWRVENRLIPYLQKLDDYGLIRSLAFMVGGIAGSMMEPDLLKVMGTRLNKPYTRYNPVTGQQDYIDTVPSAIGEALSWGSRWFTGIPLYELTKKGIYSQPDYEATYGDTQDTWNAFLDLQSRAMQRGIINGRWSVKLSKRLPYHEWVQRMYTSLKTYANTRGVY